MLIAECLVQLIQEGYKGWTSDIGRLQDDTMAHQFGKLSINSPNIAYENQFLEDQLIETIKTFLNTKEQAVRKE